jgi:hypothetical protein
VAESHSITLVCPRIELRFVVRDPTTITSVRDVTGELHALKVDQREVMTILSGKLNQAQFTSTTRIDMPAAEVPQVSLFYSKRGKLTRVETSLAADWVSEVAKEIESKLLAPTRPQVDRVIAFVNRPAKGSWQCDPFALTEAPDNAMRPPHLIGDYPIVFEMRVDATPDAFFNIGRASRLRHEYGLLLNLFVPSIKMPRSTSDHHWGITHPGGDDPPDYTPLWFQEFYSVEGFQPIRTDYTLTDTAIPLVPDDAYYDRRGLTFDSVFDLPQSLATWIRKYLRMARDKQRRTLRAAYWLRHAEEVYPRSRSASLMAMIQAVEVLLPKTSGKKCEECGLTTGLGPRKKFANFLDEYAPATDDEAKAARKSLYTQRSQIAHGHHLLLTDEEISFGWQQPSSVDEWTLLDEARRLTRQGAISWFISQ